ncbi:MAG: YfiR family protein [Verrucomicrobia bacterium]|jgi:hypothetical protein|nr:YfiR family protein [Verrucomicrobiota bacterium]
MRLGATTILAAVSAVLVTFGIGRAQEAPLSEYRLKAAFLFNFAKFVEWPPEAFVGPKSPMVIGVLGDNPFGTELEETVRNKVINERPVVVKVFQPPAAATNCHILFISTSEKKRLPEIFESLRRASVLTVGETDGFTETGGMINFVPEGNKMRFQINDEAARKAKLSISSKLLSLALRPPR